MRSTMDPAQTSKSDTAAIFLYALGLITWFDFTVARLFDSGALLVPVGVLVIGSSSLALAFVIRAWPLISRIWHYPMRRVAVIPMHATILILAGIPAKRLISKALELPAGEFPLTLAMVTLLGYALVVAFLILVLTTAFYAFVTTFTGMALVIRSLPFGCIAKVIINKLTSRRLRRKCRCYIRAMCSPKMIIDTIGAVAVALMIAGLLDNVFASNSIARGIRLFAYFADYERASAYPGVEALPFKLHDNGVVSYAIHRKGNVKIRVDHVQAADTATNCASTCRGH